MPQWLSRLFERLPVSKAEQEWIDRRWTWLYSVRPDGPDRCPIILPTAEFLPDSGKQTARTLPQMVERVAEWMNADIAGIETRRSLLPDDVDALPCWRRTRVVSSGTYTRAMGFGTDQRYLLEPTEPVFLAVTIAHEIGHLQLVRSGLLSEQEPDAEETIDLYLVYRGLGVLAANAAFRFIQYNSASGTEGDSGWSALRAGFLPQNVYGYALARFARERSEPDSVGWSDYLGTDVREAFRAAHRVRHRDG